MEIDAVKMGRALIDEAIRLISEKDEKSTLIERHFLIDEAWNDFESEPQPILMGKGLCQVLSAGEVICPPIQNCNCPEGMLQYLPDFTFPERRTAMNYEEYAARRIAKKEAQIAEEKAKAQPNAERIKRLENDLWMLRNG